MSLLHSLQFHFGRWRAVRDAERGLPRPDAATRRRVRELCERFAALPVMPIEALSPTEADWNSAMNRLRELGSSTDPRAFQRWDVIVARMAQVDSPATPVELETLRADAGWASRWEPLLEEVCAGRPIPYAGYPSSSEVLIQTAHSILRLERLSGRRVDEWETIVEFGGGFGGMCRAIHALGFSGRYLIFDLAPFTLLQRYYLTETGVISGRSDRVELTSEFAVLEQFVNAITSQPSASFWATWSLSEVPVALRERIKPLVAKVGSYCLAFQGFYGEVDNREYFTYEWVRGEATLERIGHRADDYYLAGTANMQALPN